MAIPYTGRMTAPDFSEPSIYQRSVLQRPDVASPAYEDTTLPWIHAWAQYYDLKTSSTQLYWSQYEKKKEDTQRRFQPDPKPTRTLQPLQPKGAPAAADTDLVTATRQWTKPERLAHSRGVAQPARLNTILPASPVQDVSSPRQSLARVKSSPTSMRTASPFTPRPIAAASPTSTKPRSHTMPSLPRPILTGKSGHTPYPSLSRSAPSSSFAPPSPPRNDTFDIKMREEALKQRRADFERQCEQARREIQRERERKMSNAAEMQAESERKARLDEEQAKVLREEVERRRKLAQQTAVHAAEEANRRRQEHETEKARMQDIAAEEARLAQKRRHEQIAAQSEQLCLAWKTYEERWHSATGLENDLSFASIPWPMHPQPKSVSDITTEAVRSFILSPLHSVHKPPKQRIRDQLLRYHPDRFEGRWLSRVRECDRAAVKEGCNRIARFLNDGVARSNSI